MTTSAQDFAQVAIIGMAGRFPGASDVGALWRNLASGTESVSHFSTEELRAAGVSPSDLDRADYVRAKGVLEGADGFDAAFFGIAPREAEVMDPQHRVFLETVWEAMESAGYDPRTFPGRIGVFAGASLNTYLVYNLLANRGAIDALGTYQTQLANDKDFLATRACYKLGLTGPGITVQTACSTSLVAVHLAAQSLLAGECDIAVAGGVSVNVPLRNGYRYERGGILSPDGHCRAFDEHAGGTVIGNGVAVVVLRRLGDAIADEDLIDGIIRGSAINNDGSLKVGYTAPSIEGQSAVIEEALGVAGVSPDSIGYVETHGTGTTLGDPIEIAALTQAFRRSTAERGFCAIGSAKSNLGHLDAAAGVTGLIKATLALSHEAIPPSLHVETPNPQLELETSPFFVNTTHRPWPRSAEPRRAGVSSFGIGGTNAHVVIEEGPPSVAGGPSRSSQVLALSARTPTALTAVADRLASHLEQSPDVELADVAFTLATRRRAFELRHAVVCADREQAITRLRALATDLSGTRSVSGSRPVAFLFPGQGTQHVGMARGLYGVEPTFTAELDRCLTLFAGHLKIDLGQLLLWPSAGEGALSDDDAARTADEQLQQTSVTQPALFAIEYALARTLMSWGIQPAAMAGHSIGEYVAACLAGVLDLEDAVAVVAARGRLIQDMPPGAMLAVFLPEEGARELLGPGLTLAAVNSNGLCVVAGAPSDIEGLERQLAHSGIGHRRLRTSHAFHSPLVAGARDPLVETLTGVDLRPPRIPFCSNVTGTWITPEQAVDPQYWGEHLLAPVRFADDLTTLLQDPDIVLVEVGPGATLGRLARQYLTRDEQERVVSLLGQPAARVGDLHATTEAVGALWAAGVEVDWGAYFYGQQRQRVRLPAYPFQRERYWVEPQAPAVATTVADVPTYAPTWQRITTSHLAERPSAGSWLVIGSHAEPVRGLLARLESADTSVVRVDAGTDYSRLGERHFEIDPSDDEHVARLFDDLESAGLRPTRVVHALSLADRRVTDAAHHIELDEAALTAAQRVGFDSLLALGRVLARRPQHWPVRLDVVAGGIFAVTGTESLDPALATLVGPVTVLPHEIPGLRCRLIDLATDTDQIEDRDTRLDVLLGEPSGSDDEHVLAQRGRYWWVRAFAPLRLAPERRPQAVAAHELPARLRHGGCYLITGGLGGIGLAVAGYLADTVRNPVIGLVSRTSLPPESDWDAWVSAHGQHDPTRVAIEAVRSLATRGARPVVLSADVTDRTQLTAAVESLRDVAAGPVNGVFHAAGVPGGSLVVASSAASTHAVLAAKTVGTVHLGDVCAQDALDFLILFSSRTAVMGGPGQLAYCAANAFLDAYAAWARAAGRGAVASVGWDTWRDVGMAALATSVPVPSDPQAGIVPETVPDPRHPLLQIDPTAAPGELRYRSELRTSDSWIVDEHRMMGHGLVPGTTYLELVRAAVAPLAADREIELREVLFTSPVIVPDGVTRELQTTLTPVGGANAAAAEAWRFRVRSRADAGPSSWQEHAGGTVILHDRSAHPSQCLEDLLTACRATEVIEGEADLRHRLRLDFAAKGGIIRFEVSGRWRGLTRMHVGPDGLVAVLDLPEEYAADLADYRLHPALLDMVGGASRIRAAEGYYLPFWYGSLRVLRGMTARMNCHLRVKEGADSDGETLTCDADVYDEGGELLVQFRDFVMKRIHDPAALRDEIVRGAEALTGSTTAPIVGPSSGTTEPESPQAHEPFDTIAAHLDAWTSAGLTVGEGVELLDRLLRAGELPEHLLVSVADLTEARRRAAAFDPAILATALEQPAAPAGTTHPRPELATAYEPPQGPLEEVVAQIWQEVLGIDRIGRDDDFFALGGHSLAAVQIGTTLRARLGADIALRDFFADPTVARTAALFEAADPAANAPSDIEEIPVATGGTTTPDIDVDELSDDEVDAMLRELVDNESAERKTP